MKSHLQTNIDPDLEYYRYSEYQDKKHNPEGGSMDPKVNGNDPFITVYQDELVQISAAKSADGLIMRTREESVCSDGLVVAASESMVFVPGGKLIVDEYNEQVNEYTYTIG